MAGESNWVDNQIVAEEVSLMLHPQRTLTKLISCLSLSFCIAINVVSQSAVASPSKYNFLIEQMAQAGPHTVQLTEQGVKVDASRMGFGVQYRASDNIVMLWSSKHHTYYTLPYEKWIAGFRNLFAAVSYYSELVKPSK